MNRVSVTAAPVVGIVLTLALAAAGAITTADPRGSDLVVRATAEFFGATRDVANP